jgi:hypothetical protein
VNIDIKTVLVLVVNVGSLALVAMGKIEWAQAKEILVWTLGPYIIGQSYENASRITAESVGAGLKGFHEKKAASDSTSIPPVLTSSDSSGEKKEEPPKT